MLNTIFNIDKNEHKLLVRHKAEEIAIYSEYLDHILKTEPQNDSLIKQIKKELEEEKEELRKVIKLSREYQQKYYGKRK
jgi:CHASE3 domain sensor protein